jgi:hypothetical protein
VTGISLGLRHHQTLTQTADSIRLLVTALGIQNLAAEYVFETEEKYFLIKRQI